MQWGIYALYGSVSDVLPLDFLKSWLARAVKEECQLSAIHSISDMWLAQWPVFSAHIFRALEGLPNTWIMHMVVPIHKSGDPPPTSELSNYDDRSYTFQT